jgi:LPS sulfotransferase NodH
MNDSLTKFIIFADARTGGTHVMSKLNSHPDIFAVSEPFPHHNIQEHENQLAWMEEFFSNNKKKKFKALGFRTKIEHQADLPKFIDYVNQNDIICFSLQRRNLVKKAISRINAVKLFKETKDYNRKSREFERKATEIRPNKLLTEIKVCEDQLHTTNDFLIELYDVSILYYEQILIDERDFFNGIIKKLRVPPNELETSVFKNTSDDLSKSLSNYEEIKSRLLNTPYLDDLEEVLVN